MFRTIKSKFVTITVLFILLSVGIPTTFLIYQFRENFKERSYIMVETTIDVILNCINRSMLREEKNIQQIVNQYAENDYIKHIRVFDHDGIILYSDHPNDVNKKVHDVSPNHNIPYNLKTRRIDILNDDHVYFATQPVYNLPECQRCHKESDIIAYLDIDTNLSVAETRFYTGSRHMIFLAIAIVVILLIGFISFFNVFINKPVKKVINALDEVDHGNINTKISYKSDDEFGILAHHFNQMTTHINESHEQIESMHFEQLQRADKLVTLGELAAEMAHEINNPTAVIMSRADYLQMEAEDNKKLKPYNEDLEVILSQASKISKITGNILKYGKKRSKDFQKINLIQVIQETINILEPRFQKKGITIDLDIQCQNCYIYGDSSQCEQVVTNLLNNAVDAIGQDGNIRIRLIPDGNEHCLLQIDDDGPGMDEHTRKQIFSPFFTTKTADKGTGLGLYIVKNICHNHDAQISCESKINEGATFSIKFKKMIDEG
ncbi:MAG: HAMP domain-containing protein [Calditrichaceae bacterium]|nr:HAMP domain-containing protein [Calditrichaceae bacterium]